jgi:hypothetical protein
MRQIKAQRRVPGRQDGRRVTPLPARPNEHRKIAREGIGSALEGIREMHQKRRFLTLILRYYKCLSCVVTLLSSLGSSRLPSLGSVHVNILGFSRPWHEQPQRLARPLT